MLLAIDVGNTNAVFALHDGKRILGQWRCVSDYRRTGDEYFVWLKQLMEYSGIVGSIERVVISSTVPRVVFNLRVLCDRYFNCRPIVVGKPEVDLGIPVRRSLWDWFRCGCKDLRSFNLSVCVFQVVCCQSQFVHDM